MDAILLFDILKALYDRHTKPKFHNTCWVKCQVKIHPKLLACIGDDPAQDNWIWMNDMDLCNVELLFLRVSTFKDTEIFWQLLICCMGNGKSVTV